jgi:hypothetical protein
MASATTAKRDETPTNNNSNHKTTNCDHFSPLTTSVVSTQDQRWNDTSAENILRCFPNQADYEDAVLKAEIVRQAAALSSQKAIEAALAIQDAKKQFGRRGFAAFLKSQIEWSSSLGKKYIKIAKTFEGVDLQRLRGVEVGTLFRLCGRKYQEVVARIKSEVGEITQRLVEDLIKELLPQKPQKPKQKVLTGDVVLEEHIQGDETYFTLRVEGLNLGKQNGDWLKEKLQDRTFGQVLAQMRQLESEQVDWEADTASSATNQELESQNWQLQEELRQQLEIEQARIAEMAQTIAQLEAELKMYRAPQSVEPQPEESVVDIPQLEIAPLAGGNEAKIDADDNVMPDSAGLLVHVMRSADDWELIREALLLYGESKAQAWSMLTEKEQQKVVGLMPPSVAQLSKAKKNRLIAKFVEHSVGNIFSIWRLPDTTEPEILTASGVAKFLQQIGALELNS